MRLHKRRTSLVLAATAMSIGLTAQAALANVGLPYTFQIDFITGADDGVRTPNISSNSSGELCVNPNLHRSHDAGSDASNDDRFHIELWQSNTLSDTKLGNFNFTLGSQPKKCYTSVPHNKNVYVRIEKTVHRYLETFAGSGVVSYT